MNIILTIIRPFFIRLMSLVFFVLPAAFDYLWEAFTNYFLDDFAESPPIVTGSELSPASNATTTGVAELEFCPCCEEDMILIYQNQIYLNQLELEVQKVSEENQKNRQNATEPNSDSDEESNYEDEPSAQQENNEAEAESPSISESSQVKPPTDETHTESNGIIEAPLIPDTFEDPHADCCATCSPMPEATDADQGTDNGRNTKETSDLTNL
jgi:hypothetical protein